MQYPLIDILRGFAALLVVFYHVLALREWAGFPTTGIGQLPLNGWIGVDLFFVISGFVIGKTALEGFARGGAWRRYYFERRLTRIVPLYVATLAIFLCLVNPDWLHQGIRSGYQIGAHLLFVHNLWHETHGSINPPNWSVGLEMQFYLLMALCTPWLARTATWKVFLVWSATAIAWRFGTTLMMPPGQSSPMFQFIYSSQLPGTLNEFVFGVCLAKLTQKGHLAFSPRRFAGYGLAAVSLLVLACATALPEAEYWRSATAIVFWRSLTCAGFAALLACIVMFPGATGGWPLWPLRYLGRISYGIYLWHMPILLTLLEKTPWQGARLLLATITCSVALAALSWHGFEQLWLRRRAGADRCAPGGARRPGQVSA